MMLGNSHSVFQQKLHDRSEMMHHRTPHIAEPVIAYRNMVPENQQFHPFVQCGSMTIPHQQQQPKPRSDFFPRSANDILRAHRLKRKENQNVNNETTEQHTALQNQPSHPLFPDPSCYMPAYYPQTAFNPQIPAYLANYQSQPYMGAYMGAFPAKKKKKKFLPFTVKKKKVKLKKFKEKKNKRKVKIKFELKKKRQFKKITKKRLKKREKLGKGGKKEKKRLKREKRRQKLIKFKRRVRSKLSQIQRIITKAGIKVRIWFINSAHILCILLGLALLFLGLFASNSATYLPLMCGAFLVAVGLCILAVKVVRWTGLTQESFRARRERRKWTFYKQDHMNNLATIA